MAEPYVLVFTIAGMDIASIVMDQADFDEVCDQLEGIFDIGSGERTGQEGIQAVREARYLPMVMRGTKTEFLFERFGVSTDRMSMCVRGFGRRMLGS